MVDDLPVGLILFKFLDQVVRIGLGDVLQHNPIGIQALLIHLLSRKIPVLGQPQDEVVLRRGQSAVVVAPVGVATRLSSIRLLAVSISFCFPLLMLWWGIKSQRPFQPCGARQQNIRLHEEKSGFFFAKETLGYHV